jgi:hypothetical protein
MGEGSELENVDTWIVVVVGDPAEVARVFAPWHAGRPASPRARRPACWLALPAGSMASGRGIGYFF